MSTIISIVEKWLPDYTRKRLKAMGWEHVKGTVEYEGKGLSDVHVKLRYSSTGVTKDHSESFTVHRDSRGQISVSATYFRWQPILTMEDGLKDVEKSLAASEEASVA